MTTNHLSFDYDVVVIGAGVAGSLLSRLLSKTELKVLLIDNNKQPPLKLAESLPDTVNPMLERLGIAHILNNPLHKPSSGYTMQWGSDKLSSNSFSQSGQNGWKIDKSALIDDLQSELAETSVAKTTVTDITQNNAAIILTLGSSKRLVNTRFVVDASGRHSWLSRQLSIASHRFDQLLAFAANVPRINHPHITRPVFVEAMRQGWGLVSQIDDKQNLVAVFTNRETGELNQYRQLSQWPELCAESRYFKHFVAPDWDHRVHCVEANSRIAARLTGDNWLLVGDAAMSFDPLSSHGLTCAMYMAEKAADAIEGHLKGVSGVLIHYSQLMAEIYNSYLNELLAYYRCESRWPDAAFWQSKQQLALPEQGALTIC